MPVSWFLMYRVELKVSIVSVLTRAIGVPNVPCGVESDMRDYPKFGHQRFLMYRVELKAALRD